MGGNASKGGKDASSRYNTGKLLGSGGSCKVVVATKKPPAKDAKDQTVDKNEYALKIIEKTLPMSKELYSHEVNILTGLAHTNILRLVENFDDKEHYYIVTDLASGGELFDRIVDQKNPISEQRASDLVKTMLECLNFIHDKGIVHRDLKPENFVFATKAQDSAMILIDFGCAKRVEDDVVYTELVGTPYYLAPESACSKTKRTGAILKSSDLWAVGVIAYVMLTGRPPFAGRDNRAIFRAIISQDVSFPTDVKLSDPFKDFVKRALRKRVKNSRDPKKDRLTVKEGLKHAWIVGKNSEEGLDKEVIRCLCQFQYQSKLKKAITKTLAGNMGSQPRKKIKNHFKRLDKNGDGQLDVDELSELINDLGYEGIQAKEEAARIIANTDIDGDKTIGFEEFAQVWQRKLLTVNDKYILAVFNILDHNQDGSIDASELQKVLEINESTKLEAMIREVDTDGDGQISFEEFKNAMKEDVTKGNFMADNELNAAELLDRDLDDDEAKESTEPDALEKALAKEDDEKADS